MSAPRRDEDEIAVKAIGDFTSRIHELDPGTKVHVDGPHGVFSMDHDEGPGFGFIAGGVGITGLLSMLRTMADRETQGPRSSSTPTATGRAWHFATNSSDSRAAST